MSDIRAGKGSTIGSDDDRLPWLEAVEEEEDRDGPSAAKLIAFVVVGLVCIGLIVGGLFWMGSRTGGDEQQVAGGELIPAPAEDYKVKPDQPGGMEVEGKGDTTFAASAGEDPKGTIDMGAVPEQPVTSTPRPQPQPGPGQAKAGREIEVAVASSARPAPAPARPGAAAPTQAPAPAATGGGGPGIQLGAFSSLASANGAWKNLSTRFKYLEPLTHSVVPVQSGGKTLYRLRASGGDMKGVCGRLRVAGESCVEVN
jgi:hypothetical protein